MEHLQKTWPVLPLGGQPSKMNAQRAPKASFDRRDAADLLRGFAFQSARLGERNAAAGISVARSTARGWRDEFDASTEDGPAAAFFMTREGLDLLHFVVVAMLFVFVGSGRCGIDMVARVLQLSGLSRFVASSHGALYKLFEELMDSMCEYERVERARLAREMKPKEISLCEDENFHEGPCLVGIEPVSGFIVLEKKSDGYDANRWNGAISEALSGLPVTVRQVTSDEAKGLRLHIESGLGALWNPDLFHPLHALSKAFSPVIGAKIAASQRDLDSARKAFDKPIAPTLEDGVQELAMRVDAVDGATMSVSNAQELQRDAHKHIRNFSDAVHPFDLKSGAPRAPEQLASAIDGELDRLAGMADKHGLPERCGAAVKRVRKLTPAFAQALGFFWTIAQQRLEKLEVSSELRSILRDDLLASAYLHLAADKAEPKSKRDEIRATAVACRTRAESKGELRTLSPEQRATIDAVLLDCAQVFQRASSCVEGRNGQHSLFHHGLHALSPKRLRVLTIMANYVVTHTDGTTAAERFFGARPRDAFEWVVRRTRLLGRPAASRNRSADR